MTLFSWLSRSSATDGCENGGAVADDEDDALIGLRAQGSVQQPSDPTTETADDNPSPSTVPRILSLFAHNATSFACQCCAFAAQDMQALRRHRQSNHRRGTFEDRFFAPCACGASFSARIAATKHATQCQTVAPTNPEPAEESEPVPSSETRADVATVTVRTPAQVFAPVLPNPHEAAPSTSPWNRKTLRLRVPGWQAPPPQRHQYRIRHGHRHVTDPPKLSRHPVPLRPDRIGCGDTSSCTRRPDD